ncbi:MAG TPA: autotransporter-associated beta strand repeat-containing protein [Allosphingosinicella sp.]
MRVGGTIMFWRGRYRSSASSIALGAALAIVAAGGEAQAQTVINSSNTNQVLSTDTAYIINQGTTVSDRDDDAIIVNGIAPATVTNAGTVSNENFLIDRVANNAVSAIRFNVEGTLVNQATGAIFGDDRGVFIDSGGINNIINYGDISARKGPAIEYGSRSGGTIDNFGTINNGNVSSLTDSSRGIGIDTSGTVTLNNHAGASIRSGPGPAPTAITIQSGDHFINNDGLIEAHRLGIQVTGGSAQIVNRGTINSSTGTVISLESRNNRLTLDTGSILNGIVTSPGADNHLLLRGTGIEDSPMTGFADLTMAGTSWTLSGAVSTTGKNANTIDVQAGTLTVTGALTTGNGGGATIATGAGLSIGGGGNSGAFAGNVVDDGILTLNRSDNIVFANLVSGTGSLVKLGAGVATLTGANSYSGGTRLEGGVLSVASDASLGNGLGGLTFFGGTLRTPDAFVSARAITVGDAGGTIDVVGSSATFTGLIRGAFGLLKTGQRTLALTGNSTGFTGNLTIEAGAVTLGVGGTTGTIGGDVFNSGSLTFNRITDLVFGGEIAGSGNIVKLGSNRLTLSGNVSSTAAIPNATDVRAGVLTVTGILATGDDGGTTVQSGATLDIGNGGSTGDLVGDVVNLGAVVFDRTTDLTYRESIIGPGTVAKQGAGTLTLLGVIASTSGVTIGGGVLQLGNGGEVGSIIGNIVNNAALTFNRSDSYEQAGVISGSGAVSQQGSGRTTLSGTNSYSGLTRIDAGRLDITGSVAGSAGVATGATLGGTGAVAGQVSIADGAHLAPGVSIGTLTVGSLVLNPGSQLDYQLGIPDIVGGTSNDHMEIGGALTLDGTLNITDVGGFSQGVYQLMAYGGTLTDNGLQVGGVPPRFRSTGSTGFMAISTATPGEVNLIVSGGGFGLQFWDGPNSVGNGTAEGGSAIWNNASTNWTLPDISSNAPWQGGFAVFQGTSGTVTLGENISFEGMQFRSDGYVIQNGGFLLQRGLDTIFRVDPGMTATIVAEIADGPAGGSTLIKEGGGTLILDHANSYLGDTLIEAGTLRVHVDANLGAPSNVVAFQGGTLAVGNDFATGRAIIFNAEGGTIEVFGTHATFTGPLSGPGMFTKAGTGELVLEGLGNSYAGGTSIDAGILTVATDSLLGDPEHGVALNGATLNVGGGFTSARAMTLEVGGGTLDTYGSSAIFTGTISGPGPLTKGASTNTIILTGDNDYGVGTTISGGALQLGNGGTTGSILGHVLNNGTLIFNRSDAYQVANFIDGTGGIEITGGGFAHLTGNNIYRGGTRITGGSTLIADFRENLGNTSGSFSMTRNSTLVLNNSFELAGPFSIQNSTETINTFEETTTTAITGVIQGAAALNKDGPGTLILTNTNTFSGGVLISDGTLSVARDANLGANINGLTFDGATLRVGDTFASARAIFLTAAGGTIDAAGAHSTFSGTIFGPGALIKTGLGEMVLGGPGNSYAGGTFINAGTLTVATNSLLGNAAGGVFLDAATLRVTGGFTSPRAVTLLDGGGTLAIASSSATFAGILSGPGALTKADAGTIILTGDNVYSGGTAIEGGVLQIGDLGGTTGSILGDVVNNGGIAFGRGDAYAVVNNISGTGTVTILNGGIATLAGNNGFTGDLRVFGLPGSPPQGSALIAEANNNLGSAAGNIILEAGSRLVLADSFEITRNIQFNGTVPVTIDTRENTVTASGVVVGPVPLVKEGVGTLILTNTNSQTGGAAIDAGTLQLGGGAGTGTLNGDVTIAVGARLVFDRTGVVVFGSVPGAGTRTSFGNTISGAGSVVQRGPGTLIAAGSHTYLGGTSVEEGRLLINGAILGPVDIAFGARLGGTGSIGGTVTIASGAILEPGTSPGTLDVGALLLTSGSLLNYDLGLPDVVGGGVSDLVNVAGALTLDGTLNIADAGGFSRGVYRLFDYGGALTDNGLLIGGLPGQFVAGDMLISTATSGQVNLIVSTGGFGLQFWDGAGTAGNGAVDGGAANWNDAASNWTTSDGVVNAPWQSGFAVFQGAPGIVTLGEPIAFEGMQFITGPYVVAGGGFGLAAAPDTSIRVDPLVAATIDATIADGAGVAARLTKTGAGLLVLGGTNSYSGGTIVSGGALQIGSDANLGAASGALSLNAGTLVTTASFASGRALSLGENGGTFSTNSTTELTLSGAIAGPGLLTKAGAGTLILSGTNLFEGGTLLADGVLAVSADSNLGAPAGSIDFDGGTLRFDAGFDPAGTRAVALHGAGGTIDTNGNNPTFLQGFVGTGSLSKTGAGTLTLTGDNVYTGGTAIGGGTLQIGDGGTTGGLIGDVVDNAALIFNRSDSATYGGAITGSGSLAKLGAGQLTLTGTSTYSGGTTIVAGTLRIGDGATSGSIAGDVLNNGALVFDRGDAVVFGGIVSGSGTLRQVGAGTLTLTGINTHSGGTIAGAGIIAVASDSNLGAPGAVLTFDGGTLLTNAAIASARPVTLASGGGTIDNGGFADLFAGAITGPGALTVTGSGTVTLAGDNEWLGGTTIASGTLRLGDGGITGSLAGDVVNQGTLAFARSNSLLFGGMISGGGSVRQTGAGATILTGINSYTGGTFIDAGTLQIGLGGTTGSIIGDVANNSLLVFDRSDSLDFGGAISGAGALLQAGSGTTILSGANSYAGGTTIGAGTLQLGNGGTIGSIFGDVVDNGALIFDRTDAVTFNGTISGTGTLGQFGAGTLTLAAINSYGGGTIVRDGTLAVSTDLNLGAADGPLTLDGGILFTLAGLDSNRPIALGVGGGTIDNGGVADLFAGPVTGPGALTVAGSGAVTLSADTIYAGGTTIAAGTLRLGNGGTTGSILGGVANGGILVFDRSNVLTFAGVITGSGSVVQQGSGTTILTAGNLYTGQTNVTNGRLIVDGSIAGDVNVAAGARLGGDGSILGIVTIADGGHLAPGNSPGTLTIGALVLNPFSQVDFEFALPGIVGGGINDLVVVTGNLTLDGTLNVANAGGLSPGAYRIFDYGGTLTDNGLLLGAPPTRFAADNLLISTATPGEVSLIVDAGGFGLQFWDGVNAPGNGAIGGGAGSWNLAAANWTGFDGAVNASWQGGFAVFQGAAGTVTLGSEIAVDGMQFRTNLYAIDGGGFALNAAGDFIIRVDPSVTATIAAPIAGAATLTKTGGGRLVLTAANLYDGGTAILGGVLQVGGDANLGATGGALTLDAGTLATTAGFATARAVTLGENGGAFSPGAGTVLTLGGTIAGAGLLGKTGGGTLILTAANSYKGGTLVGAGVLGVSSDSNLGASTAPLLLDGGTLRFEAGFDPAASRAVSLGALGGTIDTNGHISTFAQGIGGTGALTKGGAGTLILTGANTFSGGTTIAAGTLRIGNGGATGSILGDIVNNGVLVVDRSNQITYSGIISAAGSLVQAGTGSLILTGNNSFTGGTSIAAGTLQIGNGGTAGAIFGDVANQGMLTFNRSDAVTFAGRISGGGTLVQAGAGTLILTGASTYTGATNVQHGRLAVEGSLGDTAVLVATGATLSGGGSIAGPVTVADGATFAPGPLVAPGILSVGALAFAPNARLEWRLGQPNSIGGPLNDLARVAGDLVLDGRLDIVASDFATLPGSYRLIDYGGALTDHGLTLGAIPDRFANTVVQTAIPGQVNLIAVRDGLAVQFWDGGDGLGNARVDGGAGAWNLTATNWTAPNGAINQSWLGGMAIFAGTGGDVTLGAGVEAIALQFTGGGYRILGNGNVLTLRAHESGFGGLVRVDSGSTALIEAPLAGATGLVKSDAGTLILTGANIYSGGTTIRGGILQIGAGGTSGSIFGDVANDGRLVFNRSDAVTFAGLITGVGAVDQIGGGSLTLTGDNAYAGGTNVRAGILQISRDANIGDPNGALLVDSATLRWLATFDLAATRPITLGAGGATFDTNGFASAVFQGMSGPGGLAKTGAGRLVLVGDNFYAGPTSIAAGELMVIGAIRSATNVGPNGTLSGTGTIFGDVLNRGLVAPGASIGTLTISGNYVGMGGTLDIETILGADDSPSDRLVIAGGAATGSTIVRVFNAGGGGALTTGDGILVVDAAGGGTTAPGAFTLAAPVFAGPYEYLLVRGAAAGSAGDDWFLRSTIDPDTPSFRIETSLYATLPALALGYGRALIGTLQERVGDMAGHDQAVWGRVFGREGEREGRDGILGAGPNFDYDFTAIQLGVDVIHDIGDRNTDVAGLYGAWGKGDGDVEHFTRVAAGRDDFEALSFGAYWTHLTPTGWYLDGVVQGTWYDMKAQSVRLPGVQTEGFGFAASIEGGRTLQSGALTIEPQAQLVFQSVSLDDVADVAGRVRFDNMQSVAGRLGVRVARTWTEGNHNAVTIWGRANLWYEFMGDTRSIFSSATGFVPLHADLGGEWFELNAGVDAEITDRLSIHANVTWESDFAGDQHGYEAQLGLRLRF